MQLRRTQLQERYDLGRVLGSGNIGVVYEAHDRLLNRQVALKTILQVDAPAMPRLYQEWYLLSMMAHPNVINFYDIGEFDHEGTKKPFLAMPLLHGRNLDGIIREKNHGIDVPRMLDWIGQACRGLDAAHRQGVGHRNIKPSNIFVLEDQSVKVLDFGIAPGLASYSAPELLDTPQPTPLSDLFAMGVVAHQLLAGQLPFQGSTEAEFIEALRYHPPHLISSLNPEVSAEVSQVVAKALGKRPASRFVNVGEFADALQTARSNPLRSAETVVLTSTVGAVWMEPAAEIPPAAMVRPPEEARAKTVPPAVPAPVVAPITAAVPSRPAISKAAEPPVQKPTVTPPPTHSVAAPPPPIIASTSAAVPPPAEISKAAELPVAHRAVTPPPPTTASRPAVPPPAEISKRPELLVQKAPVSPPALPVATPSPPQAAPTTPAVPAPPAISKAAEPPVRVPPAPPVATVPAPATVPAAPATPAVIPDHTPPPPPVQRKGPAPIAFRKLLYGVIAALSVLLVMAGTAYLTRPTAAPVAPPPVEYKVNLLASVLGADIQLNGKACGTSTCTVTLGPGNYRAEAQLAGYLPAVETFTISPEKGAPGAVGLNLVPAPSLLTLSTDLQGAALVVDGDAAAQLVNGSAAVPRLTPGVHEVTIRGGGLQGSLSLEIANGAAPRLAHPIQARGMRVFVLTEMGTAGRLYGNQPGITVTLDNRLIGDLASQGIDLAGLVPGTHELTLEGPPGRTERMIFESKGPAAIYAKMSVIRASKP